jgi:hypothetical protein
MLSSFEKQSSRLHAARTSELAVCYGSTNQSRAPVCTSTRVYSRNNDIVVSTQNGCIIRHVSLQFCFCVFNCIASIHTRHTAAVCSVWHTNTTQNSAEGAEGYSYPFALHCSESKENPAYSMPAPSRKSSTKCRRIALSQTVELKIGRADGMDDRVSKQAPIIIRLAQ